MTYTLRHEEARCFRDEEEPDPEESGWEELCAEMG